MALISVPRFEQTICLPAEFGGSIRHVFKNPLSATADEDDPNSVTTELSPPLKMGPLEFRIEAGIVTGPDLSFFLQCNSLPSAGFPWRGTVRARFRITDCTGEKITNSGTSLTVHVSSEVPKALIGFPDYFHRSPEFLKKHVENDALHLDVFIVLNLEKNGDWIVVPPATLSLNLPSTTLGTLLDSSELADVDLESKEGDKVAAHRVILAASTPVFRTMFATDMKEKAESVVKIEDMGTKALRTMLKFLYTGDILKEIHDTEEFQLDVFMELVNAGEKYELPTLMKLAGMALLLRCEDDNMLELFVFLKKYANGMQETLIGLSKIIKDNVECLASKLNKS